MRAGDIEKQLLILFRSSVAEPHSWHARMSRHVEESLQHRRPRNFVRVFIDLRVFPVRALSALSCRPIFATPAQFWENWSETKIRRERFEFGVISDSFPSCFFSRALDNGVISEHARGVCTLIIPAVSVAPLGYYARARIYSRAFTRGAPPPGRSPSPPLRPSISHLSRLALSFRRRGEHARARAGFIPRPRFIQIT